MVSFHHLCAGIPVSNRSALDSIIVENEPNGRLFVLKSGEVEILRNGVRIALVSDPGALFGEISILTGALPIATVRTTTECEFYIIHNGRELLMQRADFTLQIADLLATRLQSVTEQLAASSEGKEGDGLLELLLSGDDLVDVSKVAA